ncbi:MAG: alkyl hydroperoxide reductase subunit F [bacterium]
MLENSIKEQLKSIFAPLASKYTFFAKGDKENPKFVELEEMLIDVAATSDKIDYRFEVGENLQFSILRDGDETGVVFRAIPSGHEFSSLLLAIMNADGKGKTLPDEHTTKRIVAIDEEVKLTTYMSLSCTNCPDVVQSLNQLAILNPNITHEAVDGAIYTEEVESLNIQAVPTVYANGEPLHVGKSSLGELLDKIESRFRTKVAEIELHNYELIVAGGGPAGVTAAIYSARKGVKVALVADRIGGQVNETVDIENVSSKIKTTGKELANDLRLHAMEYNIDIFENRKIENFEIVDGAKVLSLKGGEQLSAPQVIIATGASWRKLSVEGEAEYIGRGVAFCPHCDGPLFKDKAVAVVGGGNSGVEAAIDLAGICSKVTLVEFMPELKADTVLQDRLRSLPNVEIFTNSAVTKIVGDGARVVAITKSDRATGIEEDITLNGVFVQIGLLPNTSLFKEFVPVNRVGEIITDKACRTSVAGVYAAGDVSDVAYKQIIISMGEGAKASLSAFEDNMRGI